MTRNAIDISGMRFGKLFVLKRNGSEKSRGNSLWLCVCDCGNHTTTRSSFLRNGNTKSCGCIKFDKSTASRDLFKRYQKDAIRRGYDFDIDFETFVKITSNNCFYCGIEPNRIYKHKKSIEDFRGYICNGIDRKDNKQGYIPKNIVPCCKICNSMKSSLPYDEWERWLNRISRFWGGQT